MSELQRIAFAGGGTGGHLFPALAVAEAIREQFRDCEILFVGSERRIERQILRESGYPHRPLSIESMSVLRRHPLRFLKNFWQARREASRILREFAPQAVVGSGGFASLPLVRQSQKLQIPTLLLEQNLVAGRATRWLSRRANRICHAFEPSRIPFAHDPRHIVTGNPVRREVAELCRHSEPPSAGRVRTILVLGGSQGSVSVNRIWMGVVQRQPARFAEQQILHQTGAEDCEAIRETYSRLGLTATTEAFFPQLPAYYRQADLVVTRAGGTTLAELACAGVPALVIPIPNSPGDHQSKNAAHFADAGAARIVAQQPDINDSMAAMERELRECVAHDNRGMRSAMQQLARPDAAARVVDEIVKLTT